MKFSDARYNEQYLRNTYIKSKRSDREILEKYIDLSNTCLHEEEKEDIMNML